MSFIGPNIVFGTSASAGFTQNGGHQALYVGGKVYEPYTIEEPATPPVLAVGYSSDGGATWTQDLGPTISSSYTVVGSWTSSADITFAYAAATGDFMSLVTYTPGTGFGTPVTTTQVFNAALTRIYQFPVILSDGSCVLFYQKQNVGHTNTSLYWMKIATGGTISSLDSLISITPVSNIAVVLGISFVLDANDRVFFVYFEGTVTPSGHNFSWFCARWVSGAVDSYQEVITLGGSALTSSTIAAPGTSYIVGDIVVFSSGSGSASVRILTVSGGGGVLTYQVLSGGSGFIAGNTYSAIGGSGTGFQLTVTTVHYFDQSSAAAPVKGQYVATTDTVLFACAFTGDFDPTFTFQHTHLINITPTATPVYSLTPGPEIDDSSQLFEFPSVLSSGTTIYVCYWSPYDTSAIIQAYVAIDSGSGYGTPVLMYDLASDPPPGQDPSNYEFASPTFVLIDGTPIIGLDFGASLTISGTDYCGIMVYGQFTGTPPPPSVSSSAPRYVKRRHFLGD